MKASTNGIETNYELHGNTGPWLVLSHSLACSVRMWDPQIAEFSRRYRVLAYDTRGHGASDAPAGAYTLEQLADDLHALLAHLGIREAHYAGLSMGGMIGQTYALKYPGVFQTLTLADTTSSYPAEAAPLWVDRIKLARGQGMGPLVEPTLARWFTEPFRKSHPAVSQSIGALIRNTPVAGYAGCCEAIPTIRLTARLKEIRTPILVIVGDQDGGTPPAMAKEIHANAPGSKYVEISPAAHLSNLEQPEQFNRALDGFLKANG
ncbi:MAG: 3-oxoadipate enol-lactonase [Betaproteobacteria bacterium]|nr:3-oxoadipate enol-lactonase [Betaproteobacteria bacterium]